MICTQFSELTGFQCHPLNEDGSIAYISSSFTFEDGDMLPIYIEYIGDRVRFFDDGEVIFHFLGTGMRKLGTTLRTSFIERSIQNYGLSLNKDGVIEIFSEQHKISESFSMFLSGILNVANWERENAGANLPSLEFIEKVANALQEWKIDKPITRSPKYIGESGKEYEATFSQDGELILAISAKAPSINAAIRKLLDISNAAENGGLKTRVIIDDTSADKTEVKQAETVLTRVSTYVWPLTELLKTAKKSTNELMAH